jgi:hypothetical protein
MRTPRQLAYVCALALAVTGCNWMYGHYWQLRSDGCQVSENVPAFYQRRGVDFFATCTSSKINELGGFEAPQFKAYVLSKFEPKSPCPNSYRTVDRQGDAASWTIQAACIK